MKQSTKERLNYRKMVQDIGRIVDRNANFLQDMECKGRLPRQDKFTQLEAKKMERLIGRIFMITHCRWCDACNSRYLERSLVSPTE